MSRLGAGNAGGHGRREQGRRNREPSAMSDTRRQGGARDGAKHSPRPAGHRNNWQGLPAQAGGKAKPPERHRGRRVARRTRHEAGEQPAPAGSRAGGGPQRRGGHAGQRRRGGLPDARPPRASGGRRRGAARARFATQRPIVAAGRLRAAARSAQARVLEQQPDRHDQHDAGDHPGGQQEQPHLVLAADGSRFPAMPLPAREPSSAFIVRRMRPDCQCPAARSAPRSPPERSAARSRARRTSAVNAGVSRSTSRPVPSSATNSAAHPCSTASA